MVKAENKEVVEAKLATETVENISTAIPHDKACALAKENSAPLAQIDQNITQASTVIKPQKDMWDKISALAPIISGLLVFGAGAYFTYTYNQQQLRLMEVQTIEKFIPHLMGSEKSKKAAILALSFLTNTKIASKFASIFASSGTVSALKSIAQTGTKEEQLLANKALKQANDNLALKEDKLNQIEMKYKSILEQQNNNDKSDLKDTLKDLETQANSYENNNQYDIAEAFGKEVLSLKSRIYGKESSEIVETLRYLAKLNEKNNKSEIAKEYLNKANEIELKLQNNQSNAVLNQQNNSE